MPDHSDFRRPAPSFLPATAVLEMTYRCNHACLFCSCPWFAPKQPTVGKMAPGAFGVEPELSVSQWKALIDRLCDMGVCNIAFTGGDPLLKPGLSEIITHAASKTVELIETEFARAPSKREPASTAFSQTAAKMPPRLIKKTQPPKLFLLTNGKAMQARWLELCKELDINLSMSLPGLQTFAEHTGGGDPDTVLTWFRRAHQMGVVTTVGVTVTRRNLHELFQTIGTAFLAGADMLLMNRFLPGGRGIIHADALTLSSTEIVTMCDIAEEVLEKSNRQGNLGTELPKCIVDPSRYKRLHIGTRCSAALDFFVVGPSGYVRVCNHSPRRLVHIDQLEQLKTHPYWKRFTMKEYLPRMCVGCRDMLACDGGCREAAHIAGGDVDSPDPLLSDVAQKRVVPPQPRSVR